MFGGGIGREGIVDWGIEEMVRVVAQGLPGDEEHGFTDLGVGEARCSECCDCCWFRVTLALDDGEKEGAEGLEAFIVEISACLQRYHGVLVEAD